MESWDKYCPHLSRGPKCYATLTNHLTTKNIHKFDTLNLVGGT